jgi:hypothetical protein
MNAQRQIARAVPRVNAQLRTQAQRRLASTETENHFVRERRHVKEHAGPTTGEHLWVSLGSIDRKANGETELWRKISI